MHKSSIIYGWRSHSKLPKIKTSDHIFTCVHFESCTGKTWQLMYIITVQDSEWKHMMREVWFLHKFACGEIVNSNFPYFLLLWFMDRPHFWIYIMRFRKVFITIVAQRPVKHFSTSFYKIFNFTNIFYLNLLVMAPRFVTSYYTNLLLTCQNTIQI